MASVVCCAVMLFRSAFSAVLRVSIMPPVFTKSVMLLFNLTPRPLVELNNVATCAGLLVSDAVSFLLSITSVPSAGSPFSEMPIEASPTADVPVPTPPPMIDANVFLIVVSVESPSSAPPVFDDLSYEDSELMVVTTVL